MLRYLDPRRLLAAARDLLDSYESPPDGEFSPTYADVCVTRAILKSRGLPTEIVLEILVWAEYEPIREFTSTQTCTVSASNMSAGRCLTAGVLTPDTIRSLSARRSTIKVKEVEFVFSSRDQGWTTEGTEGTFNTSSWLEVSILRPMPNFQRPNGQRQQKYSPMFFQSPVIRQSTLMQYGETLVERPEEAQRGCQGGEGAFAWYLQGNRVASQGRCEEYRVVWGVDHHEGNEGAGDGLGFLEALREGDEIVVWARAKVSFASEAFPLHVLILTSIWDGNVWLRVST
jgi:hypothetical protein